MLIRPARVSFVLWGFAVLPFVICYELQRKGHVTVQIFNLIGEAVMTLVDEEKDAGFHSVVWRGTDARNREVVSGVYFYQLRTRDFVQVKKMILLQ